MTHPHTVAHRIFNYGIEVGVRTSATHTDAALTQINPYQSLGPKGSKDAMNEVIKVRIPVAVIVMYKMQFEPILFYKYSEMLKVYKWIKEHLSAWLTVIQYDHIRKLPPIEELFAMEELAYELHPYLVDFYGPSFEETTFVHVPDRIDRLISILGRKVGSEAPKTPNTHAGAIVPFISVMEKIMELKPNG